jgi:hypothetical protein
MDSGKESELRQGIDPLLEPESLFGVFLYLELVPQAVSDWRGYTQGRAVPQVLEAGLEAAALCLIGSDHLPKVCFLPLKF